MSRKFDAKQIINWLEKNKDNTGMMSDLRKGLNDELKYKSWLHLGVICDISNEWQESVARTISALFSIYRCHSPEFGNFGFSIRLLDQKLQSNSGKILKRLMGINDINTLCLCLPHIVNMMKSKNIPINYERLCRDVFWWGYSSQSKEKWCESYHANKKDEEDVSNKNNNS